MMKTRVMLILYGVGAVVLVIIVWYWFGNSLMPWQSDVPAASTATDSFNAWLESDTTAAGLVDRLPIPATLMVERAGDVVRGINDTILPVDESAGTDPFPTPAGTVTFLTDSQRAGLEAVGIDTSTLPTTLTPELEACFVTAIGRERVDEIIAGDTPGVVEFLQAKHCVL